MNLPSRPRRRLLHAAALSPLLSLAAPAAAAPRDDRMVRVIGPWELSSLDPLRNGYLFSRMQVTETLVDYDAGGRAVPGLAQHWRLSPDQLQWSFTLRDGARFHDGAPVRPADVAAALTRARHAAGVLGVAPIAAIATDAHGVRIRLTRPFAPLPALLSHSSTQVLAPASFAPDGNVRASSAAARIASSTWSRRSASPLPRSTDGRARARLSAALLTCRWDAPRCAR